MHPRRQLILIFALFLSVYAWFYNGGGGNQVARFNQTRAIAQRGTLYVDRLGFATDDQIRINGHSYSSKAPGTSLLGVPFYALFQGTTWVVGLRSPLVQNIVAHLTTIFTVGVPTALMCLALYLFLVGVGVSPPRALLGAMVIGFGTIFFPYATMFFGHSLAAAFAFGSFYLLREAAVRRRQGQDPGRRVFYAALLIGAAVVTEYPVALAAVILSLYLALTRPSRRELLHWAAGGAVALVVLAIYNTLAFGDPLALSYLNYQKAANNVFPVHSQGMGGVSMPKRAVLEAILWSKERGLLRFSPVVVLVVPGILWLFVRRRDLWREGLVIVLMVVGFLAFNAGYGDSIRYWGGANSAGPRHVIPMLPFAGLAIGLLVEAAPWLCLVFILPSIAICLAVTAVMPQVPMLFGDPIRGFIVPYFLSGRLALHRGGLVSRHLTTSDSIAYSWGKLIGLPGSWAMLPLYAGVGVLLVVILRDMRAREPERAPSMAAWTVIMTLFLATLAFGPLVWQRANAKPLEGPGVLASYYPDKECTGKPILVSRERDLSLIYAREDIRPFPGAFCAHFSTEIDFPRTGDYAFRIEGGEGEIRIDGKTVLTVQRDVTPKNEPIPLSSGPHRLELIASVGLNAQRLELRWRPPLDYSLSSIPAARMKAVPPLAPPSKR